MKINNVCMASPSHSEDDMRNAMNNLLNLANGHFISYALYAVARVGVADVFEKGEYLTIKDIAERLRKSQPSLNQDALQRCLALLSCDHVKVFAERASGSEKDGYGNPIPEYSLTAMSKCLKRE
eukprot:Nk52_evm2s426 gene=Nk52_evmTU2s426